MQAIVKVYRQTDPVLPKEISWLPINMSMTGMINLSFTTSWLSVLYSISNHMIETNKTTYYSFCMVDYLMLS